MKRFFTILFFLFFLFSVPVSAKAAFVWAPNEIPNENDILKALHLDMSHYAGMYYKDDILHIKFIVNQQNITEAVKEICCFSSMESIAFQKHFEKNIIIEYDGVYSLQYLEKVMDNLPEEQLLFLSLYGIGIKPSVNGFSVCSDAWTEAKKQQTAELLGVEINHIEFEISSGIYIDD